MVETPRYIVDLSKEQRQAFVDKVGGRENKNKPLEL